MKLIIDLELCVPGTYIHNELEIVRIAGFNPTLAIMPSKQRPRRVGITGINGVTYTFLLKGHEDLRQDERVMQLFGLINNLLALDLKNFRRQIVWAWKRRKRFGSY